MNRFMLQRAREQYDKMKEETPKVIEQHIENQTNNYGCVQVHGGSPTIHLHVQGDKVSMKKEKKKEPSELPDVLKTEEAQSVLNKLHSSNLLDENYMPSGLSCAQAAYLVEAIANKLNIKNKWATFDYWGINNLSSYYQKAIQQKGIVAFDEIISQAID